MTRTRMASVGVPREKGKPRAEHRAGGDAGQLATAFTDLYRDTERTLAPGKVRALLLLLFSCRGNKDTGRNRAARYARSV